MVSFLLICWAYTGLLLPSVHATVQEPSAPQSAPPTVISEGHTYSGSTDQIYHFQVRSDSTVVLGVSHPDSSSVLIPATFFEVISERIRSRLFESQVAQSQLDVGLEDRSLRLSLIQHYDLLLLGGAGISFILLVSLAIWLGWRLRKSRLHQRTLRMRYRALHEGEERERRRVAREIHDGPVQSLHGLHLQIAGTSLARAADSSHGDGASSSAQEENVEISNDLMDAVRELRAISEGLHPASLERFGLVAALRSHARRLTSASSTSPSTSDDPPPSIQIDGPDHSLRLSDTQRLALYRMSQEALTNAVHHAQATCVTLETWQEAQAVHLVVSDDGCGFDTNSLNGSTQRSTSNGLGLMGLRERATMVGASLTIQSTLGKGTTVSIVCPCPESS